MRERDNGLPFVVYIVVAAVAVLALVATCVEQAEPETLTTSVDVVVEGAAPDLTEWSDPATGCTYLVHRLGGVTPRLNAAGRPLCRGGR